MTHTGIEKLRWLNYGPYKTFGWRLYQPEVAVVLPPSGGTAYPVEGSFDTGSLFVNKDIDPASRTKPWWKPDGDSWDYQLTWDFDLTDIWDVFGLGGYKGAPAAVLFELQVERIQVTDQGEPYYNIDKPVWTFDVGDFLGKVVYRTISQGLQGNRWVARNILQGYLKSVNPVKILASLGWKCWHELTAEKQTRAEFRCKIVYGWHIDYITRVKGSDDASEQVQPVYPDPDAGEWELVGFAGFT